MTKLSDRQISDDLQRLLQVRIFFGHQSVGQNILDGLGELLADQQLSGHYIQSASQPDESTGGFLWHQPIGQNTQPLSKCRDFSRIVDQQLAGRVDFALFKFCYIDIDDNTDIDSLFDEYRHTMDALRARHGDIHFVHSSVPLRHNADGPGTRIRELLGRPNRSKLANINRNRFNRLLLEHYGNDSVFDLAASESTDSAGRRCSFSYKDGSRYSSLLAAYTDDGGHLNHRGRIKVAGDFIHFMAALINARSVAEA